MLKVSTYLQDFKCIFSILSLCLCAVCHTGDNLFAFAFLVSSQEACFSLTRHVILSAMRVVGPLLSSVYFGHDNVWKCKQ